MAEENKIADALQILEELGMPRAQQNDRSALCLLALLNLTKGKSWAKAGAPLVGITPMMEFARDHYAKLYAPNSRETFRRQTIHQMVAAGIALYNPDNPSRPVNSPKAVYQIESDTLALLRSFGTAAWNKQLEQYLKTRQTLTARYAREREMKKLPVKLATGATIRLSPGDHSELIKAIIEEFAPRYVPGGALIYAGDTGAKWGYFDKELLVNLGVTVDGHGKMPDVVLYYAERKWLLLVESVTSHGPVDGKRHAELNRLFGKSKVGLVYVTAFPSRSVMSRYLSEIAWETEVWCADAPSHLIHFNGQKFLGPYR
jgi:BsuBI/PstI restriction endonuclease domain/BsuBI/PstI restriction endonuclease HTH domain